MMVAGTVPGNGSLAVSHQSITTTVVLAQLPVDLWFIVHGEQVSTIWFFIPCKRRQNGLGLPAAIQQMRNHSDLHCSQV